MRNEAGFVGSETQTLPIAFDGMAGWLHRPVGPLASVGVVVVPPIGRDARCAQLSLRLLGEVVSASGYPVLRYDPPGQGDSLDIDVEGDVVAAWRDAVAKAVKVLKAETGCGAVVLLGLKLGADIALLEADKADALVLLSPLISGRRWIRQLRLSAQLSNLSVDGPGLEVHGLQLSADTLAAASAIDVMKAPPPAVPIFAAGDGDAMTALADQLSAGGATVLRHPFEEHDALFLDADVNHPPLELIEAVRAWLGALPQTTAATPKGLKCPAADLTGSGFIDHAVEFGAGLRGVLTRPTAVHRPGVAVVFLNTGGEPRAGVGRWATLAARELAQAGIASLRFDLAGIGDSPAPEGLLRTHVFEHDRTADLDAAADFLASQGHDRLVATGICSGAYHVIYWAAREPRLSAIMPISAIRLVWKVGEDVAPDAAELGRATSAYAAGVKDPKTWLRLLKGQIDVISVGRTLLRRTAARLAGRFDKDGGAQVLRDAVKAISDRGGKVCLLNGQNDSSLDELANYFGARGARFTALPGMTLVVAPHLNHGLALAGSRATATAELLKVAMAV